MNPRIVVAFVSRILSMINLPRESVTATEMVAWWTSMPIYFSWLITALLSVSGDANNHNLPQSGRLLYCVQHYDRHGRRSSLGGSTIICFRMLKRPAVVEAQPGDDHSITEA